MSKASTLPRFVLLSRDGNRSRYRVIGGIIAGDWAKYARPGIPAWCEITVYDGDPRIASYGGEVWPMAWPELFDASRGSAQTGPQTWLTEAGLKALAGAVAVAS
jgi:hypothetical protein